MSIWPTVRFRIVEIVISWLTGEKRCFIRLALYCFLNVSDPPSPCLGFLKCHWFLRSESKSTETAGWPVRVGVDGCGRVINANDKKESEEAWLGRSVKSLG